MSNFRDQAAIAAFGPVLSAMRSISDEAAQVIAGPDLNPQLEPVSPARQIELATQAARQAYRLAFVLAVERNLQGDDDDEDD